MKKLINTLQISFSVIGAVIGAGFITGREIMRFFYGKEWFYGVIIVFFVLFILLFALLNIKNEKIIYLIEKSNYAIFIFNILIMASMLGAADSLAYSIFSLSTKFPVFSIGLLVVSTYCCFGGMEKLSKVNLFIVPIILIIFFVAVTVLPYGEKEFSDGITNNYFDYFSYGFMNIFLAQPFLLKIKREKSEFSPFGVAIISSIILSVSICAFLRILSEDCLICDVPLILLAKNNYLLYFLFALIIFISIFTTLTSVQYPFVMSKKSKFDFLPLVCASIIAFIISRIGFFVIVDKIYPIIAVISMIFYAFIFAIWLFLALKEQRKRTLNQPKYIKQQYLPLQDQVLIPDRRKR